MFSFLVVFDGYAWLQVPGIRFVLFLAGPCKRAFRLVA